MSEHIIGSEGTSHKKWRLQATELKKTSIVMGTWRLRLTRKVRESSVAQYINGEQKANSAKRFSSGHPGACDRSGACGCAGVRAVVRCAGLRERNTIHGIAQMPWSEPGERTGPALAWAFAESVWDGRIAGCDFAFFRKRERVEDRVSARIPNERRRSRECRACECRRVGRRATHSAQRWL